ncbi:MAG: dihydrofolate reductase, partial [Patescibacteria group bacterium]
MNFSVIAAIDKNRGLGKDGKLTWNLPGDLKHFQSVTTEVE